MLFNILKNVRPETVNDMVYAASDCASVDVVPVVYNSTATQAIWKCDTEFFDSGNFGASENSGVDRNWVLVVAALSEAMISYSFIVRRESPAQNNQLLVEGRISVEQMFDKCYALSSTKMWRDSHCTASDVYIVALEKNSDAEITVAAGTTMDQHDAGNTF